MLLLLGTALGCPGSDVPPCEETHSCTPDSGTGTSDSGTGTPDSGTDITDAGTGTADSGTDIPDAGTGTPDSGTDIPDAGDFLVFKDGVTYYTRNGVEPRPTDFSTTPPQLIVDDGGTPVFVSGTVTQPGTIRFDVPPGTYLIKSSNTVYVQTSARTVDLGYRRAGRPERGGNPLRVTTPYPAPLELSGLQPATAPGPYGNSFSFYSMDLEEVGDFSLAAPLAEGQTSLVDADAHYNSYYGSIPRFDPAQRDSAWFLQSEGRDAGTPDGASEPWIYSSVVGAAHLDPFSFNGEGPLAIKATLAPSPQRDLTFDWRRDEFAALRSSASASSDSAWSQLEVYPVLNDTRDGWVDYEVAPMLSFTPPDSDTQTAIARTFSHGTAYPADWEAMAFVWMIYNITLPNHDGSRRINTNESFEVMVPTSTLASQPIQPRISLPRDFEVEGQPALQSRILGSATPKVTWAAPALGNPSGYTLLIDRLRPTSTIATTVARIFLDADQRSVRIPPGLFVSGETYHLRLRAVSVEGLPPGVSGFRGFSLPFDSAQTVSGLFTVP